MSGYVRVTVDYSSRETERLLEAVNRGGLISAQYNAMKRAAERAKTESGRLAAARYIISKSQFMSNVSSKVQAHGGAMVAVSFSGTAIPLKTFRVSSSVAGVKAQVKQGGGGTIRRAFIDEKMGGGVFERKGKARLPIEQKYSLSAAQMLDDEEVSTKMEETIAEEYEKRLEHELARVMNGW